MRALPRGLLIVCCLLVWFNTGVDAFRHGDLGDIPQHPWKLFVPPWLPLRAYVTRNGDVDLYYQYATIAFGGEPDLNYLASKRLGKALEDRAWFESRIRKGSGIRLPYRDFPFEYPPLSLLLICLPRVVASSPAAYRLAYGILVSLLTFFTCVLAVYLARKMGKRGPPDAWENMAWLLAAVGPVLISHFDILPAFFITLSLFFLSKKKSFAAGLAAGAGVMAKLYPLLLLLPWCALLWAEGKRRDAIFCVIGTAVVSVALFLPFYLLAPTGFISGAFYYGVRPFGVESFLGALVALRGGKILPFEAAYNVLVPHGLYVFWSLLLPLSVLILTALSYRQGRQAPSTNEEMRTVRLVAWTCATLALIVVTNKGLSPQYMIWFIPLVALVENASVRRWAMVACVITQIYYPFLFDFLVEGSRLVAFLVVLRNGVLGILALQTLRWVLSSQTPITARA